MGVSSFGSCSSRSLFNWYSFRSHCAGAPTITTQSAATASQPSLLFGFDALKQLHIALGAPPTFSTAGLDGEFGIGVGEVFNGTLGTNRTVSIWQ
jgi:hypothetical protein